MAYLIDNMEMPEPATFSRGAAGGLEMEDDHYGPVASTSGTSSTETQKQNTASASASASALPDGASADGTDSSYVSFSMPGPSGYHSVNPDSPEVDIHVPHHKEMQQSYQIYHASMANEETVKCIVSSTIFIAIIALVLIIAFTTNPMMS